MSGRLTVVGTPIGNLGDVTSRAIETLRDADLICCEDTRRTGMLLAHLGLPSKKYVVANEHTEREASVTVLAALAEGRAVALVTDAGTPVVSDPGARIVRAALDAGHEVTIAPGVSALTAALPLAGFDVQRFAFEGFLPRSGAERTERLRRLAVEDRAIVLYEAPHRLARTLADLEVSCGSLRRVTLARELTKMHEEVWRGTLREAVRRCDDVEPRGEYVVVVEAAPPPEPASDERIVDALRDELARGTSRRDAATLVAAALGAPRRRVYELALALG